MAFLNLWVNSLAFLYIVCSYSFVLNYDALVLRFIHGFKFKHTPNMSTGPPFIKAINIFLFLPYVLYGNLEGGIET